VTQRIAGSSQFGTHTRVRWRLQAERARPACDCVHARTRLHAIVGSRSNDACRARLDIDRKLASLAPYRRRKIGELTEGGLEATAAWRGRGCELGQIGVASRNGAAGQVARPAWCGGWSSTARPSRMSQLAPGSRPGRRRVRLRRRGRR
jgi:hypothetical protein